MTLLWTDSLEAPRSVATRQEVAVALIEDPGIIELRSLNKADIPRSCGEALQVALPENPWETAVGNEVRVIWVGPGAWRILLPRAVAAEMAGRLAACADAVFADLTGGTTCFRVVGDTAREVLARVCPLDLGGVEVDQARGTSIGATAALVIREAHAPESWLVLAPRSYADYVGESLSEAARTPGRLALFEPSPAPPV